MHGETIKKKWLIFIYIFRIDSITLQRKQFKHCLLDKRTFAGGDVREGALLQYKIRMFFLRYSLFKTLKNWKPGCLFVLNERIGNE